MASSERERFAISLSCEMNGIRGSIMVGMPHWVNVYVIMHLTLFLSKICAWTLKTFGLITIRIRTIRNNQKNALRSFCAVDSVFFFRSLIVALTRSELNSCLSTSNSIIFVSLTGFQSSKYSFVVGIFQNKSYTSCHE